jgi:uracil-DNA glycosylase
MSKVNGDLTPWIEQGVFLLNAILTVEKSNPSSHKGIGWDKFTDNLIKVISENCENVVFLLWGKFAESKKTLIDNSKHLVLISAHPSHYSAHNFFGNNHFKLTNQYLKEKNKKEVDWIISDN